MAKYVFLYKDKSEDRDCCAYIECKPMRWECGHYFGRIGINGACYSKDFDPDYDNIETTILSRAEYQQLLNFAQAIEDLGYGITKGDERYQKGVELCKAIQPIYDKLNSAENQALFDEVWEEEKEYIMDEYNLDEEDIDNILDEYSLDYRDRSIVSYIYDDAYDLGYNTAWNCGYVTKDNERVMDNYFDYEELGRDVCDEEYYVELQDGRIAALNY